MHHLSKIRTQHLKIVLAIAVSQIPVTGGYRVHTFAWDHIFVLREDKKLGSILR